MSDRTKLNTPREIQPSIAEIGDEVIVTHKEENGVTMSLQGIIGKRMDHGDTRHMLTAEGRILFAWNSKDGRRAGYKLTLVSRLNCAADTLWNEEAHERVA